MNKKQFWLPLLTLSLLFRSLRKERNYKRKPTASTEQSTIVHDSTKATIDSSDRESIGSEGEESAPVNNSLTPESKARLSLKIFQPCGSGN